MTLIPLCAASSKCAHTCRYCLDLCHFPLATCVLDRACHSPQRKGLSFLNITPWFRPCKAEGKKRITTNRRLGDLAVVMGTV